MFIIFSFSYSNTMFDVSARGIYTKEDVIKNGTGVIDFEITEITIKAKSNTKDTYFEVDNNIETANENFIKGQKLKVTNVTKGVQNGNQIYFKDNENNSIDTIKFSLKGTLIFNWKETNKNPNLAIGYRREENHNKNTSNYITVNLSDVKPITLLKINVKEDLNLGKGIAGTVLDTSKGSGSPAIVEATGEYGKNVKFKILSPENIKITSVKNSKESLKVDVWFEQNHLTELQENLNEKTNLEYIGKTPDIKIHGKCQSNSNNHGIYKGSFIVRVEYDD